VVPLFTALGLSPNALTLIGLLITAISSVFIGFGMLPLGGAILLLAAGFDILDGAVARVTGKVYRYGAFLDSTTDRYCEGFTAMALLSYYLFAAPGKHSLEPMLVISAMLGSLLVSYIRARAQSLGFSCEGGMMARPERVVLTVIGLLLPGLLLVPVLWLLAVFTNVTAVQRIFMVWRQARATVPADL
jgi:CDP-diacylglycerol--glycerol-3-phosphate 3-phosphatidyltransferase